MFKNKILSAMFYTSVLVLLFCGVSTAWNDETHMAIGKAAGYHKWYNAAGADMTKIKAGKIEGNNHFVNNPPDTRVTPEMVMEQVERYNDANDKDGHLYGAVVGSLRNYMESVRKKKYKEYHLAFCLHYIGDLSMPLHNTIMNAFNRKNHITIDGIINHNVLNNINRIELYPIIINSEEDLAKEIARIANLSIALGYRIEQENRLLTEDEAYEQIGHSASLFKAVLVYLESETGSFN